MSNQLSFNISDCKKTISDLHSIIMVRWGLEDNEELLDYLAKLAIKDETVGLTDLEEAFVEIVMFLQTLYGILNSKPAEFQKLFDEEIESTSIDKATTQ